MRIRIWKETPRTFWQDLRIALSDTWTDIQVRYWVFYRELKQNIREEGNRPATALDWVMLIFVLIYSALLVAAIRLHK